jgi:hypothetical protein
MRYVGIAISLHLATFCLHASISHTAFHIAHLTFLTGHCGLQVKLEKDVDPATPVIVADFNRIVQVREVVDAMVWHISFLVEGVHCQDAA